MQGTRRPSTATLVLNNPLEYTDPSGYHTYCQSPNADPEDCEEIKADNPWTEDEGYDPDSDSIPEWGDDQSDVSDINRSQKVWGWLCSVGGWWGSGCPSERDLIAWMLWREGSSLLNDSIFKQAGQMLHVDLK